MCVYATPTHTACVHVRLVHASLHTCVCVCAFLCVSQHRCMLVCENHLHAVFSVGLQSVSLVRAVIPDEALFLSPASVSERGVNTWRSQNPLAAACEHKMLCFMTAGAKKTTTKNQVLDHSRISCIVYQLPFALYGRRKKRNRKTKACFSLTLIQLSGKQSGTFNNRSPVIQKQMSHRDQDFYLPGFPH